MKILILMGSPRNVSNTAELTKPFIEELKNGGAEVEYIELKDKNIAPCKGCYACQQVAGEYGCAIKDDMYEIVDEIVKADIIILATPIYSFYCTTDMKALLDRHYGLNKYYGSAEGSLWEGKKVGVIATHGYDTPYATEAFELGIKHLCQHSKLNYIGMYSVEDTDDLASFQTAEAIQGAKAFAKSVLSN